MHGVRDAKIQKSPISSLKKDLWSSCSRFLNNTQEKYSCLHFVIYKLIYMQPILVDVWPTVIFPTPPSLFERLGFVLVSLHQVTQGIFSLVQDNHHNTTSPLPVIRCCRASEKMKHTGRNQPHLLLDIVAPTHSLQKCEAILVPARGRI